MTATWQPAPILFPDAEAVLVAAYRAALVAQGEDDVRVDRKVPNPLPARLVAITRDGGTSQGLVDRPRMRFRVFDTTEQDVDALARLVVALAQRMAANGTVVRAAPESGPYGVPDASKRPHRYLLIEFTTRGELLP